MGENKSCMSLHAQWCCQAPRYPMRTPKPYPDPNRPPQLGVDKAYPFTHPHTDLLYVSRIPTTQKESGPRVGFKLLWEGQNLVQVLS